VQVGSLGRCVPSLLYGTRADGRSIRRLKSWKRMGIELLALVWYVTPMIP
jgi:hypothetical protein